MLISNTSKAKAFLKHYLKVSSGSSKIEKVKRTNFIKPFSIDEVQSAIQDIKRNKSPGMDGIFAEFIKNIDLNALIIVLTFLNFVLSNGHSTHLAKVNHRSNLETRKKCKRIKELQTSCTYFNIMQSTREDVNGQTSKLPEISKNNGPITRSLSTE